MSLDDIAFRVLAAAGHVAASRGEVRPNLPSLDDLAALARAHLATGSEPGAPSGTLAHAGAIVVSRIAARQYVEFEQRIVEDVLDDQARIELTRLMLNARSAPHAGDPDLWRVRDRGLGIELVARVIVDGRLRIVAALTATDLVTATRSV